MKLKLTRGILMGDTWYEAGSPIDADGRYAEQLVRSGAAFPFVPAAPIETAEQPPRHAERATAPRQQR